jgi:protein SDA1
VIDLSVLPQLVPPDSLEEVIRVITNHFVNEHGAAEATSIGLNTFREVCNRQPNAISDKELLRELTSYKKNHDKGIMMASRSIIALYRNVNPGLLPKNDRVRWICRVHLRRAAR